MLYRFSPDQSIPAFSLHSKLFPSLYRCLWCRLLRGNSLLETTESSANDLYAGWGYCFHVLHSSCVFLFRYQLYMVFSFYTMDHLFPQKDTMGLCVVIEETFKNTWTLVQIDLLFSVCVDSQNSLMLNSMLHTADPLYIKISKHQHDDMHSVCFRSFVYSSENNVRISRQMLVNLRLDV